MNALRIWGFWVSAACLLAALGVAAMGPSASMPPTRAGEQIVQTAAEPVGFIVRFRGDGPIARAQALAARGRLPQAERQVEAQLARQRAFAGLCFERFTVGGAEIVLRACEDVPAAARAAFQARWLAQLGAMRAVDYADINAAASAERAPG